MRRLEKTVFVQPKLDLEISVRGGRRARIERDIITKSFRRWLAALILPTYTTVLRPVDYNNSEFKVYLVTMEKNSMFCDIVVGKDSRSESPDDYRIYSPAKFSVDGYGVVDISETDTQITFGLLKNITMRESATLAECGLFGTTVDEWDNTRYFLVVRNSGLALPVSTGDKLTIKYTVTLTKQSLTGSAGFTKWFNRALAMTLAGAGVARSFVPLTTADGAYSPGAQTLGSGTFSTKTLYDPGSPSPPFSGIQGYFSPNPSYCCSTLWRLFVFSTSTGADEVNLGSLVDAYGMWRTDYSGSMSESSDRKQLTATYWEYLRNDTTTTKSIVEWGFFSQAKDSSLKDRAYLVHKAWLPSGASPISVAPSEMVKGTINIVLS